MGVFFSNNSVKKYGIIKTGCDKMAFELTHLKGNTYYIRGKTNLGLYKLNDKDVILIDVPFKKSGPAIETFIRRNGFNLKYIINTHSHPDHTGSNEYLIKQTGCKVITSRIERAFLRNDKLDIGFLAGGYPLKAYDTPLMHVNDQHDILSLKYLPDEIKSFKLPGHHYDMRGFKTKDGVYFVADSICTKELIDNEHIMLIYDVAGYIKSLEYLKTLKGHIIVPSHAPISTNLDELVDYNLAKIEEIKKVILTILNKPLNYDNIFRKIFEHYHLNITYNKYLLISSTIRSYISYLENLGFIESFFNDNILYFRRIK